MTDRERALDTAEQLTTAADVAGDRGDMLRRLGRELALTGEPELGAQAARIAERSTAFAALLRDAAQLLVDSWAAEPPPP